MNIDGAVTLVTGASRGIGEATARLLADAGAHLILAGRDEAALATVAKEVGGTPVVADLAGPDGPAELVDAALSLVDRIDVLVANAGVGWRGDIAGMPAGVADQLLRVDLLAPIELTRLLLPGMVERGRGHVAAVSSIAGSLGVRQEAVYAAAKAGLTVFATSLRQELTGTGVGVSVVVPGVVDTEFFTTRGTPYARRRPRPMPPEAVASAVVRAISSGRTHTVVPRWLSLPIGLHALSPKVYDLLAGRFG